MKYFEFNDFDELVLPPGDYIHILRETVALFTRKLLIEGGEVSAFEFFEEFGRNVEHTIKTPEVFRTLGWDLFNWPKIDTFPICDEENAQLGISVQPLGLVGIYERRLYS